MKELVEGPGPQGWGTYEVELTDSPVWGDRRSGNAQKILVPGFFDRHIHGAYGADFMSSAPADLAQMLDRLAGDGYEGLLATTVTATLEQTRAALDTIPDHPLVLGIHLEGPFISPEFPGAQPPEAILDPPADDSPWWDVLLHPRVRQVTLAPERQGAQRMVQRLLQTGRIAVAAGHTNATYDQITAMGPQVSYATHMFNAMSPLHHREPGAVGAFLLGQSASLELIYDRHHVSKPAVELALKCRYPSVLAVSDCTMAKGLPPGTNLEMWGHKVTVGPSDVRLASNNALAGSASTLLDCFRNLASDFDAQTACHLCCTAPRAGTEPQKWLLFDNNLQLLTQFGRGGPK